MEIVRLLLIVVEVICCVLLIGVILLQQSKSQGMGLAFGGGMGESLFGSRAGNVLTKITVILAMVFLANTTLLGILYTSSDERSLVEKATVKAPQPVAPQPNPNTGMMSPPQQQSQGTLFPTGDQPQPQATAAPETPAETVLMPVEVPATTTEFTPVPAEEAEATPAKETVSP